MDDIKGNNMNTEMHASEVAQGERFEFGKNWSRFIDGLTEEKIKEAELSLKNMLRVDTLEGLTFLDIGSGSGLFSLAARRLGAKVTSFDYDPYSVACTTSLREKYCTNDVNWKVDQGSVLDNDFMSNLGQFDVVYSWGVLHHTGNMKLALTNAANRITHEGLMFVAIYNDQGWVSKYWTLIKRLYNRNRGGRLLALAITLPYFMAHKSIKALLQKQIPRGMTWWTDVVDWVGGYPFEVASPEYMIDFYYDLGFALIKQKTVENKLGCNEFVFKKLGH